MEQNKTATRSPGSLDALVMRFVEIMDRQHTPTPYEPPKSTYNEAYHGGDCEKHGRWYGICHSCRREQDRHYEDQQSEFDSKQKRDLRDLADEARQLSHNAPSSATPEVQT